ncbi:MAG: DNA mismatch endonuclease Vsr [Bacteroidetes bacterium]|nr:DNA mismatch endonuclease Vsr [Bacteroidota bacterium]
MDVHNKKTRSFNMSQIKGKNTKPELLVRKYLHSRGLRFRLHDCQLPGKPDIVLSKYRLVIQVHGCFWHKHKDCKYFIIPKTRTEWWLEKLSNTARMDIGNKKELAQMGWNTIVVWECELKGIQKLEALSSIYNSIVCEN